MNLDNKFILEPAFVLHLKKFKETSLIIDLFTRKKGKISVIAKGAQRPKSKLRVIKTPSSLFSISCIGKGELKTLTHCEIKEYFTTANKSYNCLVYLNELLVKFLEKEDPHIEVFDQYLEVCKSLYKSNEEDLEINLRFFELTLLREAGYGLNFSEANTEKEIKNNYIYKFDPEVGFLMLGSQDSNHQKGYFKGEEIIKFSRGDLKKIETRKVSKQIMRQALDFHLGNKNVKIREYLSHKGDLT